MVAVSQSSPKPRASFTAIAKKTCLILFSLIVVVLVSLLGEGQSLLLPVLEIDSQGNSSAVLDQSSFPVPPGGLIIGYAVSITYCHPDDFIADAAAVLQHSVHLVHQQSRYGYQMISFVHPDAQNCTQSLKQLGYKILIKDTPVDPSEMRNEILRHEATTTGCCGEREFLKLYALTLTQYPIVVHLDLDCLLLQPLDPLFDAMMLPDSQNYYHHLYENGTAAGTPNPTTIRKYIPDAMWSSHKTIPITSYFVRDYNMVKGPEPVPPNRINMQGGFWIVKPHRGVFEELCEILRDGVDYSAEGGWGGPHLMPSHYYGVAQIQGLLSYYYGFFRPFSSVELNRCHYNNMVDNPNRRQACHGEELTRQCQDCRYTPLSKIRSIHLTLCQKPWWCPGWIKEVQCSKFHYEWHRIREDLESLVKAPPQSASKQVNTSDMTSVLGRFRRHCRRSGSKGYRPIDPSVFSKLPSRSNPK